MSNTGLAVVALDRLLKSIGVNDYTLTETRLDNGKEDSYAIPIFVLGVELNDEDATIVALRYSVVDIVNEINTMSLEIVSKLKSIQK
jgi:hypothetical protein